MLPVMDWELKASSTWDFTVIGTEDDHDPRLAALVSSDGLGLNNNRGDFSVDLKLGRLVDMADDKGKAQKGNFNASSPSGSSKRARAISGAQIVTCLVDGCMADLSGCREYHRRHRVCERHSKTPVVSVGGKEQRFCQQCSRFQSLVEFDEEKRSCRKRLDGHNRRRRKPQPEAFYVNQGGTLPNHQGARLLQFGNPEAYTSSSVPTWPSVPEPPVSHHSAMFLHSSASIHNGADKHFPFLLVNERSDNHQAAPEVTVQTHFAHNGIPTNVNPHRVHSLLSSPRPIHNSAFNPSTHQQMGPTGSQFGHPAHQHSRSPAGAPQASTYHNSYSGNEMTMVSLSPDDLLEKGASQVFPFAWK